METKSFNEMTAIPGYFQHRAGFFFRKAPKGLEGVAVQWSSQRTAYFSQRDAAILWAESAEFASEDAALSVRRWQMAMLAAVRSAILLPAIRSTSQGALAYWTIVSVSDPWTAYGESYQHVAEIWPWSTDVFLRHVQNFMEEWVDDFVRRHAPLLEARQLISGPLGRRLLARLLRPRAPWPLNPDEFGALARALKEWQEEAQRFLLAQSQQQVATLSVRVSRIREGRGIQITLGDEDNKDVLGSLGHILRDWSNYFAPWLRAMNQEEIVPVMLTEEETDQFWEYELPRLMGLGVTVEFPKGWSHASLKAMGRPDGVPNIIAFSPDQLTHVDWDIALNDRQLSMEDLEKLAQTKEPVVHIGAEWIVADTDLVERARRMYEKVRHQKMTLGRMLRYTME
ncbi:MAG: SNF2 helicase-associated domain-containing protein, partial [Firmicutes bacterium]|nr:SNF2 helicase-associated domain-containing protein [Bacillota bacterium]